MRQHITFQIVELLFNVSESTTHNTFHYGLSMFHKILPESLFPQLQGRDSDWSFAQASLEQHDLIIDGSEQ